MSKRVVYVISAEGNPEQINEIIRELPAPGDVKYNKKYTSKVLKMVVREDGDDRPFKLDVE